MALTILAAQDHWLFLFHGNCYAKKKDSGQLA